MYEILAIGLAILSVAIFVSFAIYYSPILKRSQTNNTPIPPSPPSPIPPSPTPAPIPPTPTPLPESSTILPPVTAQFIPRARKLRSHESPRKDCSVSQDEIPQEFTFHSKSSHRSSTGMSPMFVTKSNKEKIQKRSKTPLNISDITEYSDMALTLLQSGDIIISRKGSKGKSATSNVHLKCIEGFNEHVFGVDEEGNVLSLDVTTIKSRRLVWNPVTWNPPIGATHLTKTLNDEYFVVQNDKKGVIYDTNMKLYSSYDVKNTIRVYGSDLQHYVEFDTENKEGYSMPDNKTYENVGYASMRFDGSVSIIPADSKQFYKCKLIDWNVMKFFKWNE